MPISIGDRPINTPGGRNVPGLFDKTPGLFDDLLLKLLDPDIINRGNILPLGRNVQGDFELVIPEAAISFAKSLMLPGHAVHGGAYSQNDVTDAALNFGILGGIGGSTAAPAGAFGMGAGRKTSQFLPMDEASRMARAKEMGFDVDTPLYHGTTSDVAAFDKSLIGSENPGYSFGFHMTNLPEEASVYADSVANGAVNFNPLAKFAKPVREGANVLPVYSGLKNPLVIESKYAAASMEADLERRTIINKLFDAKKKGAPYDGVVIKGPNGINVISLDPSKIRSRFAAFDPEKKDSSDILAVGGSPALSLLDNIFMLQDGDHY